MKLESQVAIVTGSTTGFGRAIVREFAAEGAAVAINYPTGAFAAAGAELVDEITRAGGRAIAVEADVTSSDAIAAMVAQTVESFGTVDILVNNAGINNYKPIEELEVDEWRRVIDVNLTGSFICVKQVLPIMLERGSGNIISIASIAPWVLNDTSDYNASKAGVIALGSTLAKHYGPRGIRANTIAPGFHRTEATETMVTGENPKAPSFLDKIPVGFIPGPESLAKVAVFLASKDSEYIQGHTLVSDGGVTLR